MKDIYCGICKTPLTDADMAKVHFLGECQNVACAKIEQLEAQLDNFLKTAGAEIKDGKLVFSSAGYGAWTRRKGNERTREILAENERLKAGRFTPEEFQEICHNLPETLSPEAFALGCENYQKELFGHSPCEDLRTSYVALEKECASERERRVTAQEHIAHTYAPRIAALESECNAWIETAAQHFRNETYYRGLVQEIGEMMGKEAYTSDDGSIQEDVLCAKVPELVAAALTLSPADADKR